MFTIARLDGGRVRLTGRFDAAQADAARATLAAIGEPCRVECAELDYISSAGIGVLLAAQKRLNEQGHRLVLVGLNRHIRDLFSLAGFDRVFDIE